MKSPYSIYLVTNRKWLKKKTLPDTVEQAILGGVTLVQIREKNVSYDEFKTQALEVQKITKKYNVPLIINDNLKLAVEINADGLHIGQKDGNPAEARKLMKNKILGISASSYIEAKATLAFKPDYIGIGAIFKTKSKRDANYIPLDEFKKITKEINVPITAIGGINCRTLKKIRDIDCAGYAVISCILKNENRVLKNTLKLKNKLSKWKKF